MLIEFVAASRAFALRLLKAEAESTGLPPAIAEEARSKIVAMPEGEVQVLASADGCIVTSVNRGP